VPPEALPTHPHLTDRQSLLYPAAASGAARRKGDAAEVKMKKKPQAEWEKLDDVSQNIREEPWSLYWREWKSGTRAFEDFLHDPGKELVRSGLARRGYSVQTNIINHERGLRVTAVCTMVIVDPRSKAAYITLYKH
jgi:hypothetical protein